MSYFSEDFNQFFIELAGNNNKEWFDANRKRYENEIREPFKSFIQQLIDEVHKLDKRVVIAPKDAIFRINRDIRFSKDKTPYKLHMSAIVSPKGRKDKEFPGLYIELNPERIRIYGGVYMPDKEQLYNIREAIGKDIKGFNKLISNKKFKGTFGEILGEKNSRIPKEFKEAGEQEELIFNKQFYFFTELPPEKVTDPKLIETIMGYYKDGKPVFDFFEKAMYG